MTSNSPRRHSHRTRRGREKTWCAQATVPVTGADLTRICRTLQIEPTDVVRTVPITTTDVPQDTDSTAVRVGSGRLVTMVLTSQPTGCTFLVRTRNGALRCGLGDDAPAACRAFPSPASSMSVADVAELDEWHGVVARWNEFVVNAGVADSAATEEFTDDFLRYVLDVYAELRAGATWRSATIGEIAS